jgi:hypothetical protein
MLIATMRSPTTAIVVVSARNLAISSASATYLTSLLTS